MRRLRPSTFRSSLLNPVGLFLLLRLLPLVEAAATQKACLSNVCFNGGTCYVIQKDEHDSPEFDCRCAPGFTGTLCEEKMECPLKCENEGTCQFDANQRPMCVCPANSPFGGPLCAEKLDCQQTGCPKGETCLFDMDEKNFQCRKDFCSPNPCEHDATCRPITESFVCECPRGLRGQTCSEDVDECAQESVVCLHNGTCVNTVGSYHCDCPSGYSGVICEQRIGFCIQKPCLNGAKCSETTDGYHCECPKEYGGKNCETKLATLKCEPPRMLTELNGVHQCLCPSGTHGENCVTEEEEGAECLVDGRECLNGGTCEMDKEKKEAVCKCPEAFGGRWCDKKAPSTFSSLINSTTSTTPQPVNTTVDPCDPSPCENGGTCVAEGNVAKCTCSSDRFVGERCEQCASPFLLPDCSNQLQEVTFGHNNETSEVELEVSPEEALPLATNTRISFLLRTNKPDGQLVQLGQTGDGDDSANTYLRVDLANGTLLLESRLAGWKVVKTRGGRRVDDSLVHVVEIVRQGNRMSLSVDRMDDAKLDIQSPFSHPLFVDRLLVGQRGPPHNSSHLFKGTLQHLRVNDAPVLLESTAPDFLKQPVFGKTHKNRHVMAGTVSDDVCAQLSSPCNHGKCTNTFNAFECKCEKTWFGTYCNRVDHCSKAPCPESATCENTHGGFVCKSPATFTPTTLTKFLLHSIDNQEATEEQKEEPIRFSFALRTRTPTAHIFNLSTPLESFWMELNESVVIFKHTNETSVTDDPLSFNLSNGQWHAVEIVADADGGLIVTFDNSSSVPLLSRFSFASFLKGQESRMIFGRSSDGPGFKGCIHNIRISSLPELSFFPSKESGVHSLRNVSHFEAELLENVRPDGCHSRDLCAPNANVCRNNALCKDLFNLRRCDCAPGFTGELCEYKTEDPGPMTNGCANQTCGGHGRCRNVFQSFICDCEKAWTGSTCEIHQDECAEELPCLNGGKCTNTNVSHLCECPRGYSGPACETEIDFCAYPSAPCKNGATCLRNATSAKGYECLCAHGFSGAQCEVDIDDCESAPCLNGGRCMDRVGGFECDCESTGYTGLLCDQDVDECAEPSLYCVNGGECSNLPGSYECTCSSGYIGTRCNHVDPCVPDAQNRSLHSCVHGTCVDPRVVQSRDREVVEHDCRCFENFAGAQCSYVAKQEKPVAIGYILGPAIALLVVSILLGCMLFFFVARSRRANQGTYSPSHQEMNGARVQMQTLQKPLKKQERLI